MILLVLACGEVASDPCARQPDPQAETRCRVGEASRAAGAADVGGAESQCRAVESLGGTLASTWAGECWFRAGEELARRGHVADGLSLCARAGRHARSCVTHSTWGGDLRAVGAAALTDLVARVPGVHEAEDEVRGAWWHQHVVGSGRADPALAKAAPPADAPYARATWAFEAMRLCNGDLACARASWESGQVLAGQALARDHGYGRYHPWMATVGEESIPKVRIYSGARRLLGTDAAEDLDIALVEALHFFPGTPASSFLPFLSDPRPRVRYTALRLYRVTPSEDTERNVRALASDPDPVVRAHVASAIEHRTWLGAPGAARGGP